MLFYDDFIKKIKESSECKFSDLEKFGLELRRKIIWLGTAVPLMLIGIYFAYVGYLHDFRVINMLFAIIFFYIAFTHIKKIVQYKIIIDNQNNILTYDNVNIKFSEVEICTLKEGTIGKKGEYHILLDIITYDKKQYIIPLMMNHKLNFVKNIKMKLESKFKII